MSRLPFVTGCDAYTILYRNMKSAEGIYLYPSVENVSLSIGCALEKKMR